MDEMNLDRALRETLQDCTNDLKAPDRLKTRVDFAMQNNTTAPRRKMCSWKRTAITVCAVLAVAVTGVFAATSMAGIYSHSWSNQKMSYAETASKVGVKLPEMFSNGFVFQNGYEVFSEARGDTGETESKWTDINAVYEKNGVTLSLETGAPQDALIGGTVKQSREVDGVKVSYTDDNYLSVPPDYELTEAQKEAESSGDIVVSVGSDQVEMNFFQFVSWEQDGKRHSLYGYDTGLTADELMDMAAEMIGA